MFRDNINCLTTPEVINNTPKECTLSARIQRQTQPTKWVALKDKNAFIHFKSYS